MCDRVLPVGGAGEVPGGKLASWFWAASTAGSRGEGGMSLLQHQAPHRTQLLGGPGCCRTVWSASPHVLQLPLRLPPWGSNNRSESSGRTLPWVHLLPEPLGGGCPEIPRGHLSIKFPLRGTRTSPPPCELPPGSWNKVRILTGGMWILLSGGTLCALQVPLPRLRCLPEGSASVCGDTWLGSDLRKGGGIFGAASLRHVGDESVLGGVLSSVRDFPPVTLSALVRGRVFG